MTRTKNKLHLDHLAEDNRKAGGGREAAPLSPACGKSRELLLWTRNQHDKCHPPGHPVYPGKGGTAPQLPAARLPPVRRFTHRRIQCQGLQPASGSEHCSLPGHPRLSEEPSLPPKKLQLRLHAALPARRPLPAQTRSQPHRNRHRSRLRKP